MKPRDYWLSRRFQDPRRYPYGIARSGDFTIAQSEMLERNGNLIEALLKGEVENPNEEDIQLKDAILKGDIQFSPLVQTWLKYSTTHHTKISISSSAKSEEDTDDDWVDEDPLD
ncbi:DUF413 domain-containing protein [Aliikangiella sp. G2MR2-5]|uniref:DUF413 domain-containing protein n=1 Tax=Aliikangiella sp. G2MR2-5 TaxID=2788943 RepID=UPI0018A95F18|nr:DUF413 domain-containing protein [Aliikangiella sp. G2MR2-5]